jgi:hypothetical protein
MVMSNLALAPGTSAANICEYAGGYGAAAFFPASTTSFGSTSK